MHKLFLSASIAVVAFASATGQAATSDSYPNKPIKMIVPFTPGTGIDNLARVVGEKLTVRLGQPVVVENRTGVAGNLGAKVVAMAPADGYTLLVTSNNLTINANLYTDKDFHAMKDLAPLSIGAWGNSTLVTRPDFEIKSVKDLIAYAKANPGKLTYASAGVGSPMHIQMEQFEAITGTSFQHIPYKGTGPAAADLMGGHVDVAFLATHTVAPNVQSGRLKALAVGSKTRSRVLPEIASLSELGVGGFSTDMWYGFLAPRSTPPAIMTKLNTEIVSILSMTDVKAALEKTGLDVKASSASEMDTILKREFDDFGTLIRKANIKAD